MSPQPRALTTEQVLLVADAVGAPVVDLPAIAALAAATAPRIEGVAVHASCEAAAAAVRRMALVLRPLREDNEVFAELLARVLLDIGTEL